MITPEEQRQHEKHMEYEARLAEMAPKMLTALSLSRDLFLLLLPIFVIVGDKGLVQRIQETCGILSALIEQTKGDRYDS